MSNFAEIVRTHAARYPLMRPQDYGKLAYQSAFGPAHMLTDEQAVAREILAEWQTVSRSAAPRDLEPIGGGFCRFHMTEDACCADAADILAGLFILSAKDRACADERLGERLDLLSRLPVNGMQAWLADYRRRGCPPARHSEAYRAAYHPHYRVLLVPLANRFPALLAARGLHSPEA